MKKQTEYQSAKSFLKETADIIKREHPKDKPMQRAAINDTCDAICKDLRLWIVSRKGYWKNHRNKVNMVKVYFETPNTAELVAVFDNNNKN